MSDTQEVILKRMLDDISSDYDKSKGSFVYDILSGVAKELESKYKEIHPNGKGRMRKSVAVLYRV